MSLSDEVLNGSTPQAFPYWFRRQHDTSARARMVQDMLDRIAAERQRIEAATAAGEPVPLPTEPTALPPAFTDEPLPARVPTPGTPGLDKALEILKQILGVPTGEPPPYRATPTPGMIRTQAGRQPMSIANIIGNIGSAVGLLQQIRGRGTTVSAMPQIASLAQMPGVQPALRQATLTALPGGAMTRAVARGFTTGRGFGGGMPDNGIRRKYRRTNPTNVHALRRALKRVEGFIRIEKRVDKILRRVAPKARTAAKVGFVKRRR